MDAKFERLGLYIHSVNRNEIELKIDDIYKIVQLNSYYDNFFIDLTNYLYKNNLNFFPDLDNNKIIIFKK